MNKQTVVEKQVLAVVLHMGERKPLLVDVAFLVCKGKRMGVEHKEVSQGPRYPSLCTSRPLISFPGAVRTLLANRLGGIPNCTEADQIPVFGDVALTV